jgi:DNA-binding NarL/FixJ family response regulator
MTVPVRGRREDGGSVPPITLIVATFRREVKTALFLALRAMPAVTIVATATSTGELISYCHAFRPNIAIVESGLPGRSLRAVLTELGSSNPGMRMLVIDENAEPDPGLKTMDIGIFTNLDQLLATFDEQGDDAL